MSSFVTNPEKVQTLLKNDLEQDMDNQDNQDNQDFNLDISNISSFINTISKIDRDNINYANLPVSFYTDLRSDQGKQLFPQLPENIQHKKIFQDLYYMSFVPTKFLPYYASVHSNNTLLKYLQNININEVGLHVEVKYLIFSLDSFQYFLGKDIIPRIDMLLYQFNGKLFLSSHSDVIDDRVYAFENNYRSLFTPHCTFEFVDFRTIFYHDFVKSLLGGHYHQSINFSHENRIVIFKSDIPILLNMKEIEHFYSSFPEAKSYPESRYILDDNVVIIS